MWKAFSALQILTPRQNTLLLVHWPHFPMINQMLETINHVHGTDAHNLNLNTTLADLEVIHVQWEGLLGYAEIVRANWAASSAVYVPLNKPAVLRTSSPGAAEVSPASLAKEYAGLI